MLRSFSTFLILFFLLCFHQTFAAIHVQASVDRGILSEEESALLTVTIKNGSGKEIIQIPEDDAYLVQNYGTSNQTMIVNGQVTRSMQHNYQVIPRKIGLVRIPEISVIAEGETFKTEAISLQVLTEEESENSSVKKSLGVSSKELILELKMDKIHLTVDEPALLIFRLYHREDLNLQSVQYEAPSLKDFLSEPYGKQQNGREMRNGMVYEVAEIKTILYPTKTGSFTVGPATISGQALKRIASQKRSRGGGSIDDFFGGSLFDNNSLFNSNIVQIPVNRKSNVLNITVNPLPDLGKPADFSGTVGHYRMHVTTTELQQLKKGDPITLTITIEGAGHIASISEPKLKDLKNFKTFESEVQVVSDLEGGKIGGKKIFKKIIVPEKAGTLKIPTVHFDFFDPTLGTYQSQKHEGVEIQVQDTQSDPNAGKIFEAPDSPNTSKTSTRKTPIQILGQDILFSLPDPSFLKPTTTVFSWTPLGIFCGAGVLLYMILWMLMQNVRRRINDPAFFRRRTAYKKFRADFSGISRKEPNRENFSTLQKAISDYISNKLNLPGAILTSKEMEEKLLSLGIPIALCQQIKSQTETLDHWQYGLAQADPKIWKHLVESMKQTVGKIEKAWRTVKS
jgi:hypothetical protein